MTQQTGSFTSASTFPLKLLRRPQIGRIKPVHIQLIPTNRCDAKCDWCSCSEVDRSLEMPYAEACELLRYFAGLGAEAATITGGGEPTLHPYLGLILRLCHDLGIKVGLVTNGNKWSRLEPKDLKGANDILTWVRLSVTHLFNESMATSFLANLPDVAIGFSFTVTGGTSMVRAEQVLKLAEQHRNVTHVRFVQNITEPDGASTQKMAEIQAVGTQITEKGIYQLRNDFTRGARDCRISLLKPLIDCTGFVYPCCGVQYATADTNHLPDKFKMCHWRDFAKVEHFNGEVCDKCYYQGYNDVLAAMQQPLVHEEFV